MLIPNTASLLSCPTVKGVELNYSLCSYYKLLSINITDPTDSPHRFDESNHV
ncbi:MAG: hypothetical protein ACJAV1_000342, partial [Paraglaciecola sp.]